MCGRDVTSVPPVDAGGRVNLGREEQIWVWRTGTTGVGTEQRTGVPM